MDFKPFIKMTFQCVCCSKSLYTITTKIVSSKMYCIILHECVKIFDKNIVLFSSFSINNKSTYFYFLYFLSFQNFLTHRLEFFFIFITKNANADWFFLLILRIFLTSAGTKSQPKLASYSWSSLYNLNYWRFRIRLG